VYINKKEGFSSILLKNCIYQRTFQTGTFEITRVILLREAAWARKNGFIQWSEIVSNWAELAEVPI
jgi:hypothetical protein